jgi:hypothetical protein
MLLRKPSEGASGVDLLELEAYSQLKREDIQAAMRYAADTLSHEEVEASQINTLRWEDHMTTAVDPSDDCTISYVGDYVKKDAQNYSARIAIIGWTAAARRADGMPASTATKNDSATIH